ncbi:MAG: rhodanese-like domain-containing protein [Actinomycetes bacterium]
MKKIKLISVLLVSVVALTACGGSGGKVTNLNVSEFATKISDSSVTLVDVRTPGEFMSGHITGATNIDFESGTFEADIQKLDKAKVYAVYCRSGNRSGQATALMVKDGFKAVFNLNGGVIDWTGAGQALVTN